jgi:plastocyanin
MALIKFAGARVDIAGIDPALSAPMRAFFSPALCLAAATLTAHAAPVEIEVQGRDGKPLAEAVAFLESAAAKAAAKPAAGVEIAQADKRFAPRVTVVTAGSAVSFPNRDKVRHHVYSFSPVKNFELKLYAGTPANPVVFDRAGIAVLGCNIHDSMIAWVVVVETPFHGQSAADGRIRLADVPPGSYRLRLWHPDLPPGAPALEQPLNVAPPGAAASVRLPV